MAAVSADCLAAYRNLIASHHGHPETAFGSVVSTCVRRYLAQNGSIEAPDHLLGDFAARLWRVVSHTGWPQPLMDDDWGVPGELEDELVAEMVARTLDGLELGADRMWFETAARQLLKACLHPEFRRCRESYREVAAGSCRRQQLERARTRISGSHCVDCPYWTSLTPKEHVELLERNWREGAAAACAAHRDVFLPEDFRAVRVFVAGYIRAT